MRGADLTRLVVDSSLTLAWCLEDEHDTYADSVIEWLVAGGEGVVPPLWPYEVANGLWMAERRGRIQAADIPRVLALLDPLPIVVRSTAHEYARREVRGRADRNAAWLQAHAAEVYPRHRGQFICIAGEELFVAHTGEEVLRLARTAHPEDDAYFLRYIPRERVARIHAD